MELIKIVNREPDQGKSIKKVLKLVKLFLDIALWSGSKVTCAKSCKILLSHATIIYSCITYEMMIKKEDCT